ncbi:MAG TPA: hypothetical protein VHB77_03745 [Planctomycetaceae bacterium]|nr:hypothetical protein [Planctomycetaceae bacterium]
MPAPWIALTLAAALGQAPLGSGSATQYRGAPAAADATETPTRPASKPIYVGPRSGAQPSAVPQPQINPARSAADSFSSKPFPPGYSLPAAGASRFPVQQVSATAPLGRQPVSAADPDPLARIREEAYRSEIARRQAERNQLQGLSSIPNSLMQRRVSAAPASVVQSTQGGMPAEQPVDPHQARIRELQLRIEQQRQHLRALEDALQQELNAAR